MLTEAKIAKAAAREKPYKLADSAGLYLLVTPAGGKLWRLNYRHGGKQKTLALGQWPVVPLQRAREAALDAKRAIRDGVDPGARKKADQKRLFGAVACSWFERNKGAWSDGYRKMVWYVLQHDILPVIGGRPIDAITPVEVDAMLQAVAERAPHLAIKTKGVCSGIFTNAVFEGLCISNPVLLMRGRLPRARSGHFPALLAPGEIGEMLAAFDRAGERRFMFTAWSALRLLPLVFARPGELRLAEWSEISFDEALWRIPAEKMKMGNEHLVPLSKQALAILREVRARAPGGKFVFASGTAQQPFGRNRLRRLVEKIGYKGRVSPHGFRAMARTLLHEVLRFSPDAIEAQLAHRVPDRLGAAYNRSQHLEERTRMMQAWADYLDELKEKAGETAAPEMTRI